MSTAVRSYLNTGLALMGAGFVTAAQITPPLHQAETRIVEAAVTLAAAVSSGQSCAGPVVDGCDMNAPQTYTPLVLDKTGSAANIGANIVNAVLSTPGAWLRAVNELAYALEITNNWFLYTPTNVLGTDPADAAKYRALVDLAFPFVPASTATGIQIAWWATANLPMDTPPTDQGCTASVGPLCPNPNSLLLKMFKVSIFRLMAGYQFPTEVNPVSEAEAELGNQIPGSVGPPVAWSGAFVKLNVLDPLIATLNYLTADPSSNVPTPITLAEIAATRTRFQKSLVLDFNPFVQNSFIWRAWPWSGVGWFFTPRVAQLCPTCDQVNPGGGGLAPPGSAQSAAATPVSAAAPVDSTVSEVPAADSGAPGQTPATAQVGEPPDTKAPDTRAVTAPAANAVAEVASVSAGKPVAVEPSSSPAPVDLSAAADTEPAAPAEPVSKPRRGIHLGRTSAAAAGAAAADQGQSPAKSRVRAAASGE